MSDPDISADRVTSSEPHVAAIVLAAGGSTRLGQPKQLLPYRGSTLLRHSVEQALASRARPVIVVLGADAARCEEELEGLDVCIANNDAWAEGMGSSIRTGIAMLEAQAPASHAAIITLCDQPLVTAAFLDDLIRRHQAARDRTIAADYAGESGVPALFPRARFEALARLDGASGAKRVLRDPGSAVIGVPCPEALVDVDTMADYERLPHDEEPHAPRARDTHDAEARRPDPSASGTEDSDAPRRGRRRPVTPTGLR